MAENKKRRGLPFFNYNKDGKGVKKEEAKLPFTFLNFFRYFKRHFSKLLSINIAMVLGNFPLFFILPVMGRFFSIASITPVDIRYSVVGGILPFVEDKAPLIPMLNTIGIFETTYVFSVVDKIILALSLLVLLTFGLVSVGTTYIIRNMLKGEPVFMWEDMKYSIRRNWRQGIIYGIIDILLSGMLVYDVVYFFFNAFFNPNAGIVQSMFFYISIVSLIFYFFMRFYIYLMMVTFDLSLFKMFKNAMIFAFLGFKRNILAGIGIFFIAFLNVLLFFTPITMGLGIALPFVLTLGIGTYIAAYAAWPKIKQIMIDPYYKEEEPEYNDGPIMRDVI